MAAEAAAIKEVLERVRWNRAETARLTQISYKALTLQDSTVRP